MLMGWVRNLKDGSVEAVLQGEGDKVNEVIKWCQTGPAAAKVAKVDVAYESGHERITHFFIR
jgi:acylphosphatase